MKVGTGNTVNLADAIRGVQCGECGCQLDGLFYLLGGRYLCEPDYLVSAQSDCVKE